MKKIPISKAKNIAKEYGYEQVVIVGINDKIDSLDLSIATYGSNKELCKDAERLGQKVIKRTVMKYYDISEMEEI